MKSATLLSALIALLGFGDATPAAGPLVVATSAPGSVAMTVQMENSHVLRTRPVVHALVNLAAARQHKGATRPVNLALVLDRSGSMQGQKIRDAREAAMRMVDLLRDGDRVAIVSYSTGVRVDMDSVVIDGRSRERVKDAIRTIHPSGSTNLAAGMVSGHEQVRRHLDSDKVNRVLLISDGLANRGVTAVPALNRIAREASQEGIVTTTLGLGADYNEDLMTAVADHGGGNYYFVGESAELASTLNGELAQMMSTVGRQATLEVTLPDGVDVQEVYGYAWQQEGPTVIVRLGDMYAGQTRAVLWRLRTPEAVGAVKLGDITLRYQDLVADGARRSATDTLAVAVTNDSASVRKGLDKDVAARIAEIELATSMQKAATLAQEGRYDEAQREMRKAVEQARDRGRSLGSSGSGLRQRAEEADSLADELEAAPAASAPERKKAVKKMKAGSYKLRKR